MVFDTVGGRTQEGSWPVKTPGGVLVSIISHPPEDEAKNLGLRSAFVFIKPNASALDEIAQLVDSGKLRPIICAEFGLQDIKRAHTLSESGHSKGKIALYVGHP